MTLRYKAIEEARKRYPTSKPRNYIEEGKKLGFVEGALWANRHINTDGKSKT